MQHVGFDVLPRLMKNQSREEVADIPVGPAVAMATGYLLKG